MHRDKGELARNLMRWYRENKREFPWRIGGVRSEWEALVTAFLLRKTRAETVAKYYGKILSNLSTPERALELGVEGISELLKPLGLHKTRAKQLYELAKAIREGVRGKLPGVGPYTLSLVRCLCFGELVPVIDVNVIRVINRLYGVKEQREIESILAEEVRAAGTCELNLALMDFAALVCKARKPRCNECPISALCSTFSPHSF